MLVYVKINIRHKLFIHITDETKQNSQADLCSKIFQKRVLTYIAYYNIMARLTSHALTIEYLQIRYDAEKKKTAMKG